MYPSYYALSGAMNWLTYLAVPVFPFTSLNSLCCRKLSLSSFPGKGKYELKPECYSVYNPYFYHYSKVEKSKVGIINYYSDDSVFISGASISSNMKLNSWSLSLSFLCVQDWLRKCKRTVACLWKVDAFVPHLLCPSSWLSMDWVSVIQYSV